MATKQHLTKLSVADEVRLLRLSGRMNRALTFDNPARDFFPGQAVSPYTFDELLTVHREPNDLDSVEPGQTMKELMMKKRAGDRRWATSQEHALLEIDNLIARQVPAVIRQQVARAFTPLLGQCIQVVAILVSRHAWHPWHWGYLERPFWDMRLFYAMSGLYFTDHLLSVIRTNARLCRITGPFYISKSVVHVASAIPQVRFDDQGRIHSEIHPAIDFGEDDLKVYVWRGMTVPESWYKPGWLTAKRALSYDNAELRRAACEKLGWTKILNELQAVMIDSHQNPQIGTLVQVEMNGRPERFLQVQCGTGRTFALPVPLSVRSAMDANAWTYGRNQRTFAPPEVRT